MTTGSITLSKMRFNSRHGVLAQEKKQPQPWEVTVTLELPLDEAGLSDDLSKTIDYREVQKLVATIMNGPPLNLAETLAHRIAHGLAGGFPVSAAIVEVRKLKPRVDFEFAGLIVRVRLEK